MRGPGPNFNGSGRIQGLRSKRDQNHARGFVSLSNSPWVLRSSGTDGVSLTGGSNAGGYRTEQMWDGSVMFRFGEEFIAPLEEIARQQQAQAHQQQQQQQMLSSQPGQMYFVPSVESPMDVSPAMKFQQMQFEQQQQALFQQQQAQQAAMYQQQMQAQQQAVAAAAMLQQQAQAAHAQAQAQAQQQAQAQAQAQAQQREQMMSQQAQSRKAQASTSAAAPQQRPSAAEAPPAAPGEGARSGKPRREKGGPSRPSNALTIMSSIGASGEITWDARSGPSGELAELFAALSEHGYVKEALRLLQDLVAGGRRDVLPMLRHKPFLRAAEHQGAVEAALAFLDLMPPDLVDNRTFNMVVSVCVGSKSLHGAFKVLGQMRERGLKPDLILYTNMITVSARCGDAERAFELYQQMRAEGIRPCPMAFGSLISACSQEILQLGPRAKRRQLVLLERAFSVLEEMSRAYIPPDLALFNALLSACGRAGEIQRLREVYALMQSRGYVPDVATYGTLVSTLARAGRPEEALEMFQHAIQQGRAGSVRLWGAAVEACGDLGPRGGAKAREIYAQMTSLGMSADAQLYGALIRVAGRAGDVEMAFKAFEEMKQGGSEPSREARSILLLAAVQAGQRDRAWEILDELARTHGLSGQSDPSGPPLTVEPCNALLASYAKEGRLDHVAEVIRRMYRLGMKADQFTYAGVFQACLAADEGDLSMDLYRTMRRQGLVLDDVTLSALLKICAKEAANVRALISAGKPPRPRAPVSSSGALLLDLLGGGEVSSVVPAATIEGQSIGEDWASSAFAILRDALQHGVKPQLAFIDKVVSCLRIARVTPPPSAPESPKAGSPAPSDHSLEDAHAASEAPDSPSRHHSPGPERRSRRDRAASPAKGRRRTSSPTPVPSPSWTGASPAASPMLTALAIDDESSFDPRALTLVEEAIKLGMVPGFSLDKGDQSIDLRLMPPAVAEVYVMVLGNAIRAFCAGGGPLGGRKYFHSITLLVPPYNPRAVMLPSTLQQKEGVPALPAEDRGSATALGVAAMLRRIKLWYSALPEDGQLVLQADQINNWLRSTMRKMSQATSAQAEQGAFLSPGQGLGRNNLSQQRSIRSAF